VTTYFAEDISGTFNLHTGHGASSTFLRSRVHLGISQDLPCPRCGRPNQNPVVGDRFECEGGPNDGNDCTVEAVSEIFGGVSSACPPAVTNNVSGQGLAIRFREFTTHRVIKTAQMPCLFSTVCTDDRTQCATNADCARCIGTAEPCANNADCAGAECIAAPDPRQPVSCGYWCHCGFCNDDPSQPCMDDGECAEGQTCRPGNGITGRQDLPNGCADLLCGRTEPERCCAAGDPGCTEPTPLEGECSLKRHVSCSTNPDDPRFGQCELENAGECLARKRSCFGVTIDRSGVPSALGSHCIDDPAVAECTSSSQCGAGECVDDTAEPTFTALFCIPKTTSAGINAAGGIPGPGAVSLATAVLVCRCGDGETGCSEECDDGNTESGDGCDPACREESP
jgi:cysteine-rich repeat protein